MREREPTVLWVLKPHRLDGQEEDWVEEHAGELLDVLVCVLAGIGPGA